MWVQLPPPAPSPLDTHPVRLREKFLNAGVRWGLVLTLELGVGEKTAGT